MPTLTFDCPYCQHSVTVHTDPGNEDKMKREHIKDCKQVEVRYYKKSRNVKG